MWFEIWIEFEMIVKWIWNEFEFEMIVTWTESELKLNLTWVWGESEWNSKLEFEPRATTSTSWQQNAVWHPYRLSKSLQQKKLKGSITTPEPQHSATLAAHATNKTSCNK